jgi:catechol 2,3-dioxygenase-like lactoylglutathione lyase family enzyme
MGERRPSAPRAPMSEILPGVVRQNGYMVRDLDAAIASWCAVGIGPWFTMRDLRLSDFRYRGEPSEPVQSIAWSNSGTLQIELVQQLNDAPSACREFLDAGGEGFHHLAWWAEDFEGAMARVKGTGWTVVQDGGEGGTRFAYFDAGGVTSTAIELSELTEGTRAFNDMVAAAAADWDGVTDPVRPVVF